MLVQSPTSQPQRQDVNGNPIQTKTAAPLDQEMLMQLLGRFNIVENVGAVSDQATPAQFTAVRVAKGYKEPVAGVADQFMFRTNLRGNLGPLNNVANNFSDTFQLPLALFLDPIILQYYQLNGAYQFQIISVDCELNFVPNEDASGVIFTTAIAQTAERVPIVSSFTSADKFELPSGGATFPIDQDLSYIYATFDVDTRDARLMRNGTANAAAWLSLNAQVRFDGATFPPLNQKNIERKAK